MSTPIHVQDFFHDGRGPELHRAHWDASGTVLLAIDFRNPSVATPPQLKHVRFLRPQVVMITPEEVIGDAVADLPSRYRPAAMFDRGQSDWLRSFAQQHLSSCHHYQLLFYDQLVEVIADGLEVGEGAFGPDNNKMQQTSQG